MRIRYNSINIFILGNAAKKGHVKILRREKHCTFCYVTGIILSLSNQCLMMVDILTWMQGSSDASEPESW
jgi:hypothetical protein